MVTTVWTVVVVLNSMMFTSLNTYDTEESCKKAMNVRNGWAWAHSVTPACMKVVTTKEGK